MAINRRAFLRVAGLTAATLSAASCMPAPAQLLKIGRTDEGFLTTTESAILKRLSYGASYREEVRVAEIGIQGWIEEQLAHDLAPDMEMRWRLRNLEALGKQADELEGYRRQGLLRQLRTGTLLRQVYSADQLTEMMVEFWTDHFNISVEKGDCLFLKIVDDREVIRKHALGTFAELLHASAASPAMLVYLDNQANRKGMPNENYARELLELHTLGIDGGYDQDDIKELARSLTGWTVKEHFWLGRYQFDTDLHDQGHKQVLGMQLVPSGQAEVSAVLDHLALHPATARHLATKLVRRFVCDHPTEDAPDLVDLTAGSFLSSGGDIRSTVRSLLLDGLMKDPGKMGVKFKRPVDFMVSALRRSQAETDGGSVLHEYLARMGQAPFAWPTPDGPPDIGAHWQANLAPRWSFALRLAAGAIEGTSIPTDGWLEKNGSSSQKDLLQRLSRGFLGAPLPGAVIEDLFEAIGEIKLADEDALLRGMIAGLIASPDFQYR